jgi:hypothetical protein
MLLGAQNVGMGTGPKGFQMVCVVEET